MLKSVFFFFLCMFKQHMVSRGLTQPLDFLF